MTRRQAAACALFLNFKEHYEKSGLGCTYQEWLEDALREQAMAARTRYEILEEQRQTITTQQARIEALEEELDRFKNGYKGGCYACEIVGQKNTELSEYIEEITGSKYD